MAATRTRGSTSRATPAGPRRRRSVTTGRRRRSIRRAARMWPPPSVDRAVRETNGVTSGCDIVVGPSRYTAPPCAQRVFASLAHRSARGARNGARRATAAHASGAGRLVPARLRRRAGTRARRAPASPSPADLLAAADRRAALAHDRPAPRRPHQGARPASRPAATCSTSASSTAACGRPPTTAAPGSRSSTTSRPARSARSRSRRRIPNIIYVGSGEGLQRPDLSTGDGIYKSTDAGKTWTHLGLRDGQQIPQIVVDPREPRPAVRRRARPSVRPERGARHLPLDRRRRRRSRRCSTRTRTPAASTSCSIPSNPDTVYAVLWEARQGPWENGAFSGPGSGLFKSTDGGTTWRQLTQGPADVRRRRPRPHRHRASRRAIRSGCSRPSTRGANGGLYRSDDAGETLDARQRRSARRRPRPSDFAEVQGRIRRTPTSSSRAEHRRVEVDRRRQDVHRAARRARRRRLPPHLDQPGQSRHHAARRRPGRDRHGERRRDVEHLVQPADRAVLSRHHRQRVPVSRLRRPAGERLGLRREPRRRRADHVPRLAPGRRRGVRLRRARSARPRHRLRRQGHRASTGAPGRCRTSRRKPCAAPTTASSARRRCCSRRSNPRTLYFASNVVWKTTNGGADAGRRSARTSRARRGRCRRTSACTAARPRRRPTQRGVIYTIAPSLRRRATDLGGHRRRPDPRHARRRQDLDERDAAGARRRGRRCR